MKRGMIIVLLMLLGLRLGFSQVSSVSQAQSMFIYNFSRLIQWPAGSINGEFVIGVVGDNELYSSLLSFVANKKVGQQAISVKKFDDPQSITRCQIVFVGDGKISRLNEVISKLQGSNSLLITERRGMVNSGYCYVDCCNITIQSTIVGFVCECVQTAESRSGSITE